jgi:hypothetical protein
LIAFIACKIIINYLKKKKKNYFLKIKAGRTDIPISLCKNLDDLRLYIIIKKKLKLVNVTSGYNSRV